MVVREDEASDTKGALPDELITVSYFFSQPERRIILKPTAKRNKIILSSS
jgi:hypothetical protein